MWRSRKPTSFFLLICYIGITFINTSAHWIWLNGNYFKFCVWSFVLIMDFIIYLWHINIWRNIRRKKSKKEGKKLLTINCRSGEKVCVRVGGYYSSLFRATRGQKNKCAHTDWTFCHFFFCIDHLTVSNCFLFLLFLYVCVYYQYIWVRVLSMCLWCVCIISVWVGVRVLSVCECVMNIYKYVCYRCIQVHVYIIDVYEYACVYYQYIWVYAYVHVWFLYYQYVCLCIINIYQCACVYY